MKNEQNLYSDQVIQQIPRLLGLLNRNKYSSTYGCFDRGFWHYKLLDYNNARLQEGAFTLALIYSNKYHENIYYRNEKILEWCKAAVNFWTEVQNKDGSFDEHYPNEHSYVSTVFSSYVMSEIFKMMKNNFDDKLKENVIKALKKSCIWISKNNEEHAYNQVIGTIPLFYNLYILTNEEWFKFELEKKINEIKNIQSYEGWFPEYNGPDIGYLSLAIYFLSKYYKNSDDNRALEMASKAIGFIKYFIHPNGTAGGEYSSRNTEFLILTGFEILSSKIKSCSYVTNLFLYGLKNKNTISVKDFDDRYFIYNSYLFLEAYDNYNKKNKFDITNFDKTFLDSGLISIKNNNYHFICNLRKGGVFRIYTNKYFYFDCGLMVKLKNGEKLITQWLDNKYKIDGTSVKGRFHFLHDEQLNSLKLIGLRMLNIFDNSILDKYIKEIIRKRLIIDSFGQNIHFERKFEFKKNKVIIEDIVNNENNFIKEIFISNKFSPINITSSKYFQKQELCLNNDVKIEHNNNFIYKRVFSKDKMKMI